VCIFEIKALKVSECKLSSINCEMHNFKHATKPNQDLKLASIWALQVIQNAVARQMWFSVHCKCAGTHDMSQENAFDCNHESHLPVVDSA